jgi:hypothetical protein
MELGEFCEEAVTSSMNGRRLPRSLLVAMVFNLVVTLTLLPVAGQAWDLAGLTGDTGAWLRWGAPLFHLWKFGADLTVLAIGAQGFAFILDHVGMGGAAALTSAWKLPLVAANIVTALVLYDVGKRLRSQRPTLIPLLWLLSPVPIFVAAGFGQVEPLTILAFVLATDLIMRERFIGAGLVIGLGIGIEYLPVLVLVTVAFAVVGRLLRVRQAVCIGIAALSATVVCFLPLLLTATGRSGLLGGIGYTAAAASSTHGHRVVGARSPSLWLLLGGISPGKYWVIAASVLCLGTAAVLASYARRRGSGLARQQYFAGASGAMLLIIVLLDPGALPQFSDLVFGALCLLSLVCLLPV